MTYFDYLKYNNYKTLATEIKLENIEDSYNFRYIFDTPINLVSIRLPEILNTCMLKIIGINAERSYFVSHINLCNIEFFNNYNFYKNDVKKITLIVTERKIIDYLNNHKIKIEYSLDRLYIKTEFINSFYINIKLKNIKELFVKCKNHYYSQNFKLIKKEIIKKEFYYDTYYTYLYLYKINLDMFKNLDEDTNINNYIKNNYSYLELENLIVTLYDKD